MSMEVLFFSELSKEAIVLRFFDLVWGGLMICGFERSAASRTLTETRD